MSNLKFLSLLLISVLLCSLGTAQEAATGIDDGAHGADTVVKQSVQKVDNGVKQHTQKAVVEQADKEQSVGEEEDLYVEENFLEQDGQEEVVHKCIHDQEYKDPDVLAVDEYTDGLGSDDNTRRLSGSSYPNIRIASDYQYLRAGSASYRSYIRNDLVPACNSYLEHALRVKRPLTTPLRVDPYSRTCEFAPPEVLQQGVETDHLFFYTASYDGDNYLASASYCVLAQRTNRPIISRVKLNMKYLLNPNGNHLTHEKNTYMLLHEMIHALGFSYQLFPKFIDARGNTLSGHIKHVNLDGYRRTVLDVAPITNRVRKHFGCSSLPGSYMEQNGDWQMTANSHFERRHFLVDVMTSGLLNTQRITEMTLAVLESSGWYDPDYDYAEPNPYGAGQGCGFVNERCSVANNNFDELCSGQKRRGCFVTGKGGGFCQSDPLSDGCKYFNPTVNFDCENPHAATQTRLPDLQVFGYGQGSKCFDGTLSDRRGDHDMSFCFRYKCNYNGGATTVTVQVGDQEIMCRSEGIANVPGYIGHINCPNPEYFCATTGKSYCKRNCMGRGECVNGQCVCDRGFSGHDCSARF